MAVRLFTESPMGSALQVAEDIVREFGDVVVEWTPVAPFQHTAVTTPEAVVAAAPTCGGDGIGNEVPTATAGAATGAASGAQTTPRVTAATYVRREGEEDLSLEFLASIAHLSSRKRRRARKQQRRLAALKLKGQQDQTAYRVVLPDSLGPKVAVLATNDVRVLLGFSVKCSSDEGADGAHSATLEAVLGRIPRLRGIDNAYAWVGQWAGVPTTEAGLEAFADQVGAEIALDPALAVWRAVFPGAIHGATPFRANASRSGSQSFRSSHIAAWLGHAILIAKPDFVVNLSHYHLDVVGHLSATQVLTIGVKLSPSEGRLGRRSRLLNGETYKTALKSCIANTLVRRAKIQPGDVVLDTMCGVGVIPIEASVVHGAQIISLGGELSNTVAYGPLYERHVLTNPAVTTEAGPGDVEGIPTEASKGMDALRGVWTGRTAPRGAGAGAGAGAGHDHGASGATPTPKPKQTKPAPGHDEDGDVCMASTEGEGGAGAAPAQSTGATTDSAGVAATEGQKRPKKRKHDGESGEESPAAPTRGLAKAARSPPAKRPRPPALKGRDEVLFKPHYPRRCDYVQWDATRLPLRDGTVDVVISDLPFGVRHLTVRDCRRLYPKLLAEIARVLRPAHGRAVLLTVLKKIFLQSMETIPGLVCVAQEEINNGGFVCPIFTVQLRVGVSDSTRGTHAAPEHVARVAGASNSVAPVVRATPVGVGAGATAGANR